MYSSCLRFGFSGGVRVAAADVNLDGLADHYSSWSCWPSHVKVFTVRTSASVQLLRVPPVVLGGAVCGRRRHQRDAWRTSHRRGPGGRLRPSRKWSDLADVANFFAYPANFTGGVRVGRETDNDGVADISPSGSRGTPHCGFSRVGLVELASFLAFSPRFYGGLFVW